MIRSRRGQVCTRYGQRPLWSGMGWSRTATFSWSKLIYRLRNQL